MARGVPQSYYVDEFADEGIMFEGAAGPPDYVAMAMPCAGERHRELMQRARNVSRVRSDGRPTARAARVDAAPGRAADPLRPQRARTRPRFKRGIERLAELYWAAGRDRGARPDRGLPPLRDGDSRPLRRADVRARDLELMAFHPLGTARDGRRPGARGASTATWRLHGVEGLHVADGERRSDRRSASTRRSRSWRSPRASPSTCSAPRRRRTSRRPSGSRRRGSATGRSRPA